MALKCPNIKVTVVDRSLERIQQWNSEKLPIYEVRHPSFLDNLITRFTIFVLYLKFYE